MRILLTGGAGFLGSWLCDRLAAAGDLVDVLDDLSGGTLENLAAAGAGVRFTRGSVLDAALVTRLVAGADRVVHLAAPVGVERVAADPHGTRRVIVGGSAIVLGAAAEFGVPAVFISSSEVYGFRPPLPVREEDVPALIPGTAPRLEYARAKQDADAAARRLAAAGARVLAVRPFNVIGPRQSAAGGAVLPRFLARARAGLPIEVHGDGRQRRTFLDVRDLAAMLEELLRAADWPWDAVNAGGMEEWSIGALAERVAACAGTGVPVVRVPLPAPRGGVEVRRRVPDLARLHQRADRRPLRGVAATIAALAGAGTLAAGVR